MDTILKRHYDQIICFMSMCNDCDRNYVYQALLCGNVVEEEHIRLIAIARVLNNITIYNLLRNSYTEIGKLILKYVENISVDKNMLYNWVENFIENIKIGNLKEYAKRSWVLIFEKLEREPRLVKELFYGKL